MKEIMIGVSARHIHFNQETFEFLFGKSAKLHKLKDLRQPGAFSCVETVSISSSNFCFDNVRIVGPFKPHNQIEISSSDAYLLGVQAPINKTGDFTKASTLKVTTGIKSIVLENSVIIPQRHIHVSFEEANQMGWKENQKVSVRIDGIKGGILDNVFIRTGENYNLELHIDLDDSNAFKIYTGDFVKLV
ncbi:MAG: PduL/EutD family phosphate acyltransferase [Bacillota bacterium]